MSASAEMRFEQGGLVISLNHTGNVATMTWLGTSDSREPSEFLDPVFRRVLGEIRDCELVIDFSGLEFMNSSTVSPIIALLKRVNSQGVKCSVQFSDVDWQRTHMRCLQTIARVLPHVTVDSLPPRA
jgi:anti-anti-sigma regulatory factor